MTVKVKHYKIDYNKAPKEILIEIIKQALSKDLAVAKMNNDLFFFDNINSYLISGIIIDFVHKDNYAYLIENTEDIECVEVLYMDDDNENCPILKKVPIINDKIDLIKLNAHFQYIKEEREKFVYGEY